MKRVIAAGHICIDITPTIKGDVVTDIADVLSPGKLIRVGAADIHTGGSVANTGIAMKLLGADVSLAGKVGTDDFGDMIESILKGYGADKGLIRDPSVNTSYSVVLAIPGIDRIFLHDPGANDTFRASDLSDDLLDGACLFHFGYPTLMKSMYENGGTELVSVMKRAKAAGCVTSLDLSAVDPNSEAGLVDWMSLLNDVLPFVDIFVPSVEELMFMLDRDRYDMILDKAAGRDFCDHIDIEEDVAVLAEHCIYMGVTISVIKCGASGMYLKTADRSALNTVANKLELDVNDWSGLSIFEPCYVPDKVVSGTGAGDTSIAAFLCAILDGYSPEDCLHLAAAEGASCVEALDALGGLRTLEELKNRINAGWAKQPGRKA